MNNLGPYSGIGSRHTPTDVLNLIYKIARKLALDGWTCRSGGADGADKAFVEGAEGDCLADTPGRVEIYLPWSTYNGWGQRSLFPGRYDEPTPKAFEIARQFHPAWDHLDSEARALHARNSHIILGRELDQPARFVICWNDGSGGTQQGLRVAAKCGIPITNLFLERERQKAEEWLSHLPRIYNMHVDVDIPVTAILVDRSTPFGNPFRVSDWGRTIAIEKYREWVMKPENAHLREQIRKLRGKDLVCHCVPEACHAEVVREIANG